MVRKVKSGKLIHSRVISANLNNILQRSRTEILNLLWPHCQRPEKELKDYLAIALNSRTSQIGVSERHVNHNIKYSKIEIHDDIWIRFDCHCFRMFKLKNLTTEISEKERYRQNLTT